MLIIGLAGGAGTGKDSIADYLVQRYGFVKFSFSDALYREVAEAFSLENEDLLRDRATKEVVTQLLALERCKDFDFAECTSPVLRYPRYAQHSPRQILQWWGTEYRRAQDPDYWLKKAEEWLEAVVMAAPYPELRPQLFVNTSVRFENERDWIKDPNGSIWHLRRAAATPVRAHASENELPVLDDEREIYNNHTLDYLHKGVDQLLSSSAQYVRLEPPAPMVEPMVYDGFQNIDPNSTGAKNMLNLLGYGSEGGN